MGRFRTTGQVFSAYSVRISWQMDRKLEIKEGLNPSSYHPMCCCPEVLSHHTMYKWRSIITQSPMTFGSTVTGVNCWSGTCSYLNCRRSSLLDLMTFPVIMSLSGKYKSTNLISICFVNFSCITVICIVFCANYNYVLATFINAHNII